MSQNRQTRRLMEKQGEGKAPKDKRAKAAAGAARPKKERTSPRTYLSEVRSELKKVVWPDRAEVVNSTVIVLIAIVILTAFVFGVDWVSSKFILWLYE